ncbi:hypothetical protein M422DRAFT_245259 [Sphaerobolus stellatus SS14]|nr:hypothetical protein M422DRAFT_245259 [Sphaerobolus stellatus SS14]
MAPYNNPVHINPAGSHIILRTSILQELGSSPDEILYLANYPLHGTPSPPSSSGSCYGTYNDEYVVTPQAYGIEPMESAMTLESHNHSLQHFASEANVSSAVIKTSGPYPLLP